MKVTFFYDCDAVPPVWKYKYTYNEKKVEKVYKFYNENKEDKDDMAIELLKMKPNEWKMIVSKEDEENEEDKEDMAIKLLKIKPDEWNTIVSTFNKKFRSNVQNTNKFREFIITRHKDDETSPGIMVDSFVEQVQMFLWKIGPYETTTKTQQINLRF